MHTRGISVPSFVTAALPVTGGRVDINCHSIKKDPTGNKFPHFRDYRS